MPDTEVHYITLEVLRVVSPEVLGQTKPLNVATPFSFKNAPGELKDVQSFDDIKETAAASARNFLKAFK